MDVKDDVESDALDRLHVAIDGPAGSGKSTVARRVATALGLSHVDTGAMYRALTWVAVREGIDPSDGAALGARLLSLALQRRQGVLLVDGTDPGEALRSAEVDRGVSQVSAHAAVREAMQRRQRAASWEEGTGTVMEGRDIGSAVLPLARCKIYLDASVEERARRRALQDGRGDDPLVLATVGQELRARDDQDQTRSQSPLQIPIDAHVVDTTGLSLDEVVARVVELARASTAPPASRFELRPHEFSSGAYRATHALVRSWFALALRTEVRGSGHQDVRGGVIYACNHVSWWDPPLLGAFIDRQVSFLAKRELFRGAVGSFLRTFGVVPIHRGRYDADAFDATMEILRAGGNVAIFPEGTRKPLGRPGPMKRGLGILSLSTGAPWLPCYVRGTTRPWAAISGEWPLELWIGPPSWPRAADALRARGYDESALQGRIGELYLAQVRAFQQHAEAIRPTLG